MLIAEYINAPVNEEFLKVQDLNVDILGRFGPVDSALVTLALQYLGQQRDIAILTGDRKLHRRCQARQVPAEYMGQTLDRITATS